MGAARRLVRACQSLLPGRRDQLVTLGYHLVGAGTDSPVDLEPRRFADQLDELRRVAEVLPLAEALEPSSTGNRTGRPRVVLTFDDAYENFHSVVWPLLAERSLPATLFVPVGFVEGECPAPISGARDLPALSWEQLREMSSSRRLSVGSHTWSHPDLRTLSADQIRDELVRSQEWLEDRLGEPVAAFCYPRGLWNARVERLVGESYRWAAIGGGRGISSREVRSARRPLRLRRTPVRTDTPASLEGILTARVWLEEWLADAVRRAR